MALWQMVPQQREKGKEVVGFFLWGWGGGGLAPNEKQDRIEE